MTVYQRTPEGKWAAYSAESPLPRKLKILLKAINGTVTEDVYATNLSAFGDVRELLRSLVQAGLIEEANQRTSHGVPNPAAIIVKLEQLVRRFSQLQRDEPAAPRAPAAVVREPVLWPMAVPAAAPGPAPGPAPRPAPTPAPAAAVVADPLLLPVPIVVEPDIELPLIDSAAVEANVMATDPAAAERAVHQAIEAMASFVLSHLPGNAFQLLPEIEALATLDDLAMLMDGYAQFAAEAGQPGQAHLAELNGLLAAGRNCAAFTNGMLQP